MSATALLFFVERVEAQAYDGVWNGSLEGAVGDANGMYSMLSRTHRPGELNIRWFPQPGAPLTRELFKQEVRRARGEATGPGASLLVYFTGHGTLVDGAAQSLVAFNNALCLPDGLLLDCELAELWAEFRAEDR